MQFQEIRSKIDRSVNFTAGFGKGVLEARYVRRCEDYFIAYLSSQSGCRLACRFCHLTRTRQTSFDQAGVPDLLSQLDRVLSHHRHDETPSPRMNVNFMARGDALMNPVVAGGDPDFFIPAVEMAQAAGVPEVMFNVSSIFPKEAAGVDLVTAYGDHPVTLFWSLYSLNPHFRKRWLPKAEEPEAVFRKLRDFQDRTRHPVVLHWALIEGENDTDEDFRLIREAVSDHGLRARLNLVRYNPADEGTGQEASESRYEAAMGSISPVMTVPGSRIVPRVGYDVKASCGMFVANAR